MAAFPANELFREGRLVYKVLTPEQRDPALMVLARAFVSEPVVSALGEADPKYKVDLQQWVEFVDYWMDHCSSNGLSVYALDEESHRIAGVFIVRDLFYFPPGFEEKYRDPKNNLTPWMNFLWDLDRMAGEAFAPLAKPSLGEAVDLWFLGVHPDYRGLGVANHLIRGIVPLIKRAGYKYGTVEATSAFTSKAATVNGFTPVVSVDAKDWLWQGKPFYTYANDPHGKWTFWVKQLQDAAEGASA